ncbi:MAG: ABC transporter permease [Pseudomonadota bacterium]|nr:ABC transporter permease [Pseudomonadota bacterium]
MDILEIFLSVSFWVATVRIATPFIFGTLGELICERAGVLNLGIEGIMTVGAMVGWMTVYQGGDLWTGVAMAAIAGTLFGLLHGLLTCPLALSQHVTGLGITLLATSLSYYMFRLLLPGVSTPPGIQAFEPIVIPLLSDIPLIGPALFAQTALTYLAFVCVAVVAYVLYATPLGLAIRMVGENPHAAEAQGINVHSVRVGSVMIGSALMAVGGCFLTLSAFNAFYINMMQGRGWICIALVIFASWRPGKALLGALLFAGIDAFQLRLQQQIGAYLPYQLFLMLPYVLSIIALMIVARRAAYPKALMIPYIAGQR